LQICRIRDSRIPETLDASNMPEPAVDSTQWSAVIPSQIAADLDIPRAGSISFGPDLRVSHDTGRLKTLPGLERRQLTPGVELIRSIEMSTELDIDSRKLLESRVSLFRRDDSRTTTMETRCIGDRFRGIPDEIIRDIRILLPAHKNNPPTRLPEGSVDSASRIFDSIQRDSGHADVTVLQNGPAEHRDFPEWAMAFAESSRANPELESAEPAAGMFARSLGDGRAGTQASPRRGRPCGMDCGLIRPERVHRGPGIYNRFFAGCPRDEGSRAPYRAPLTPGA
jgi:hypothetical protein